MDSRFTYGKSARYTQNMIALDIADIRDFTTKLFLQETFDHFELTEAEFLTRCTFTIDGRLAEPEEDHLFSTWDRIRPAAFAIIRGKETPHAFRVTLRLSDENMQRTLAPLGAEGGAASITSLLMNIRFEGGTLRIITGCAYSDFTRERGAEQYWDEIIRKFLRRRGIAAQDI